MRQKLLSERAESVLAQSVTLRDYVVKDGPLDKEIRRFVKSAAAQLLRDCKIQDWNPEEEEPGDIDRHAIVNLFPRSWDLAKVGAVAFQLYWANPFWEDAEPLCLTVRIPWNWSQAEGLRLLVMDHIPEGFTNVYDGPVDADDPIWRYFPIQDFVLNAKLDVESLYKAILSAFKGLLSLRPLIDDYMSRFGDLREPRKARRELGVIAVVDTETAGPAQEMIELAVVNAAYDKQTGEVLGILAQYEGLREPKCRIPKTSQRWNGLGHEQVCGQKLDESRIRSLLTQAEYIVAHKPAFDRARLEKQFTWAATLLKDKWRDSLSVDWKTEPRDLPSLLDHYGVECEHPHRAGPDARATLELLSFTDCGRSFLKQLLSS